MRRRLDFTVMSGGSAACYPHLNYSRDELKAAMRVHYDKIIAFVTADEFKALMLEMSVRTHRERPQFVSDVLLNPEELAKRGVVVPDGILIQRSAFGDRRPTLFAVKHYLPERYSDVWQNVNITFDNDYFDSEVSRERQKCWRPPLDPHRQAQAMVDGEGLEDSA